MFEKYYLFYLLALVAEVLGTVSGFGSSILFVPIASLFFDFKAVLGITALFHIFSNVSKLFLFQKGIDRKIALNLGLPAVAAVIVGALLTDFIAQELLSLIMSIALVLLSVALLVYAKRPLSANRTNLISGGILSGFLAGLLGSGGALRGVTLAAFQLEKDVFLATSAFIDLGVDFSRGVIYFLNGYLRSEYLTLIPFLLAISFVGSWLGKQLLNRIPQEKFKLLVLLVIIGTSLVHIVFYFR